MLQIILKNIITKLDIFIYYNKNIKTKQVNKIKQQINKIENENVFNCGLKL